jgi:1-acyl-sn-glycerol-3-phosphate acyltransferase
VLFPEGTSSDGKTVLPFKSPLLAPVVDHLPPLFAGFINYTLEGGSISEEVCYWRDMALLPHLLNLLGKEKIATRLAVVPHRLDAEGVVERKELARQLHLKVLGLKEAFAFSDAPQRADS